VARFYPVPIGTSQCVVCKSCLQEVAKLIKYLQARLQAFDRSLQQGSDDSSITITLMWICSYNMVCDDMKQIVLDLEQKQRYM